MVISHVLSPRETDERKKDATANKNQSGFAIFKMFAIKASCCVGIRDSMRKWVETMCLVDAILSESRGDLNRADC